MARPNVLCCADRPQRVSARCTVPTGELAHHSGVLPHPPSGVHGFMMPGFDSYVAMNGHGDAYHAGTMWDKQQRSASHLSQLFMTGSGADGMDPNAYSGVRWNLPPGMVPGSYVDADAMQHAAFPGGVWGGAPSGMYMGQSGNYEMAYPAPMVGYPPSADGSVSHAYSNTPDGHGGQADG